ncbi:hypothetical protein BVER_01743 [Candidatus Burkholderia verschuerenii]|uniref:Uncharacterized protein n=2 Tax=Candidatus Burkholderia verschuerenii TaxID=242163 RepID=A0A0L0MJT9_9BURK|nr:hypothetical protein BVER_01743 [Candidatus Burkholderia verschuerenii]
MKGSFFGSWWYIGPALLAYYAIVRLAFSLQTIDPAHVVLEGVSCDAAAAKRVDGGYCNAIGKLSYSVVGTRWLTPEGRPDVRVQVPKESGIAFGAGAEHFPGGSVGMAVALILPFVFLFAPAAYALLRQMEDIGRRWRALLDGER